MTEEQSSKQAGDAPPASIIAPDTGAGQATAPPQDRAGIEPDAAAAEEPRVAGRRASRWIPAAALLLALAALAASAWSWREMGRMGNRLEGLSGADAAHSDLLQQSLQDLERDLARLEAGRAALESARQDSFNDMAGLSQRLASMEQSLASLQGMSTQARDRWVRAEVEYLLGIANARLQLSRDLGTAATALRLADARLSVLEDPGLLEVRREIRRELMELDGVKMPDLQGISLTLGNLAASADKFPLSRGLGDATGDRDTTGQDAADASGWDRAVNRVGDALKDLVSVRRSDEPVTPLLSPSEEYFLLRNLELKLEAARLALLTGNEASYRDSLRSARRWLGTYFDVDNSSVSGAIDTLAELELRNIQPALPDISGSLRQLRGLPAATAPQTP